MKKILILFMIFACFIACNKNDETVQQLEQKEQDIKNVNIFNSKEELQELVYSTNSTESYNIRKTHKITGYQKINSMSNQDQNNVNDQENLLEELIPNNNLRNIVNEKGEFVIADTIYRITSFGTFYTELKHRSELDLIDSIMVVNAPYIRQKLRKVGNVYLYETFSNNGEESTSTTKVNNYKQLKSPADITSGPNILAFPVKSASRWTIVGGWVNAIFGEDKWQYEPIEDHRRLAANLYDYNYVVVKAAGFKAKVQHNNTWFGTWGIVNSWGRPLTIGWRNMVFEISMPELEKMQLPQNPIYTNGLSNYNQYASRIDFSKFPFAVGDGSVSFIIPIISLKKTFTYADLQQMIYQFTLNQLVAEMNKARDKGFMVDIPSQNKRYIYIASSERSIVDNEINQDFFSNIGFEIYFGNQGGYWDYLGKSVVASQNMKYFRLVEGMAYVYTPNATGGYAGMVVKKFSNE